MQSLNTFWLSCLDHFKKELNAQQFNTWIKPLQIDPTSNSHEGVVLIAPNRFVSQWVRDNFIHHIEVMAQNYFAKEIAFNLKLSEPTEVRNNAFQTLPPLPQPIISGPSESAMHPSDTDLSNNSYGANKKNLQP